MSWACCTTSAVPIRCNARAWCTSSWWPTRYYTITCGSACSTIVAILATNNSTITTISMSWACCTTSAVPIRCTARAWCTSCGWPRTRYYPQTSGSAYSIIVATLAINNSTTTTISMSWACCTTSAVPIWCTARAWCTSCGWPRTRYYPQTCGSAYSTIVATLAINNSTTTTISMSWTCCTTIASAIPIRCSIRACCTSCGWPRTRYYPQTCGSACSIIVAILATNNSTTTTISMIWACCTTSAVPVWCTVRACCTVSAIPIWCTARACCTTSAVPIWRTSRACCTTSAVPIWCTARTWCTNS